jgi:tRNA/tmRNA/rRNA uracil-C5-methylase (TrmA/RlmC/RlmD family)
MLARNVRSAPAGVDVACETDATTATRLSTGPVPDLLVADPPRSGLGALVPFLASSQPPRLVMVSCHPMTAVRDLGRLAGSAGYRLESLVPVDMFPQTDHLEIVAGLVRQDRLVPRA